MAGLSVLQNVEKEQERGLEAAPFLLQLLEKLTVEEKRRRFRNATQALVVVCEYV